MCLFVCAVCCLCCVCLFLCVLFVCFVCCVCRLLSLLSLLLLLFCVLCFLLCCCWCCFGVVNLKTHKTTQHNTYNTTIKHSNNAFWTTLQNTGKMAPMERIGETIGVPRVSAERCLPMAAASPCTTFIFTTVAPGRCRPCLPEPAATEEKSTRSKWSAPSPPYNSMAKIASAFIALPICFCGDAKAMKFRSLPLN